jgi:hypothetical protein
MDDDYDDSDFFVPGPPRGRQVGLIDLMVLSLHFVSEITSALHSTAVTAYNMAAQHANYKIDQREFRDQAARAIESMTTGETDDG